MATLGGLLLILGAFFTVRGQIYYAVGTYAVADFIWLYLAYANKDYVGASFILIGTLLGVIAFIKMNIGSFHKTIYKGKQ